MRKYLNRIFYSFICLVVLISGFYSFWLYPRYSVPILTYHSFDYGHGLLSVSPENFERQMKLIKQHGYHVISFDEAVEEMKAKRKFAHNTVVITIDDGYQNNYTVAYPILKKYGFPATIFLATNFMDTKQGFLTWDQVREMSHNGISFGGHTKNHSYLPAIGDKNVLWDEIAGSKEMIEKQIARPVYYFCYPNGGFTEQAKITVQRAGYKGACTTTRGFDLLNRNDFYEINRISVRNANPELSFSNLWAPIRFMAKLSGYYNIFRKGKSGY